MEEPRSHSQGRIPMLERSPSPQSVIVLDSPEILNLFMDGFNAGFKQPLTNLNDDNIFESEIPDYTPTKARPRSNSSSQTKVPRTSTANSATGKAADDEMAAESEYQEDVVTRELTPEFIRFADLVFDWVDNNCAPFRTGWMEGTKVDALFAMCGVDAEALETLRKKRYRGLCFFFQNLECDHVLLSSKTPSPPALHRRSTIRTARAEIRRSSVVRFSAPVNLQSSDSCRRSITGLGLRQRLSQPQQPQYPQCPAPPSPGYRQQDHSQRILPRRRPRINTSKDEKPSTKPSSRPCSPPPPPPDDIPPIPPILAASSFPSTITSSSSPYTPALPRSGFYKVLLALSAISLDALPVCVLAMSGGHSSCDPALHPAPRELENWLPPDVRESLQACFHGAVERVGQKKSKEKKGEKDSSEGKLKVAKERDGETTGQQEEERRSRKTEKEEFADSCSSPRSKTNRYLCKEKDNTKQEKRERKGIGEELLSEGEQVARKEILRKPPPAALVHRHRTTTNATPVPPTTPTAISNTKKKRYRSPPPPPASVPVPPPLFSGSVAEAVAGRGLRLQQMRQRKEEACGAGRFISSSVTVGGEIGGSRENRSPTALMANESRGRRVEKEEKADVHAGRDGSSSTRRRSLGW